MIAIKLSQNCVIQSLKFCPDFDTASAINPLFDAFHSIDMKPILTLSEYKEISNLKQIFEEKNQRMESLINSTATQKMSNHRKAIDGPKMKKLQYLSQSKISWFKMLAESVDGVIKDYGPVSVVTDFWELVAQSMRAKGFKTISYYTCLSAFREYVNDYYGLVFYFQIIN